MAGERAGHSLQATALVNEAYLRLVEVQRIDWQGRAHFLAMCARLMRRVLIDHARSKGYQKRGAGVVRVTLDEFQLPGLEPTQTYWRSTMHSTHSVRRTTGRPRSWNFVFSVD